MMTRRELLVGGAAAVATAAIARQAWGATARAASAATAVSPVDAIIGESPGIVALRDSIRSLAARATSPQRPPLILVLGETGAGKDLAAQVLHCAGPRCARPYVAFALHAVPSELMETYVFGYARGAFTYPPERPSMWELAHGGTLVLDQIGLMPRAAWLKIVRVLETGTMRRLGSVEKQPIDAWTIATTWPLSLDHHVGERTLREWLAPLDPVVLSIPPLRDRGDDIQLLADSFLTHHCRQMGKPLKVLTPDARQILARHTWPGNVRELSNIIERAVAFSDHREIGPEEVSEG
jgi:two-component system, NtrC family, response regulator AtoC